MAILASGVNMECITWDIDSTDYGDEFTVSPIGDVHLGARACNEKALVEKIERIKSDPNHYWIGTGDYHDAVGRNNGDKRADERLLAKWLWGENRIFDLQRQKFLEYVRPIAHKCLGLLVGNHEKTVESRYGIDMYYYLAEELQRSAGHSKVLTLGYSGFIRVRFRRSSKERATGGLKSSPWTIYAVHGFGGGRKAGSKALKLEDMVRIANADVYMFAHVHAPQMYLSESRLVMNQKGVILSRPYVATLTGTFLESYLTGNETYSEQAFYTPGIVGSPEISISPWINRVKIAWEIRGCARE